MAAFESFAQMLIYIVSHIALGGSTQRSDAQLFTQKNSLKALEPNTACEAIVRLSSLFSYHCWSIFPSQLYSLLIDDFFELQLNNLLVLGPAVSFLQFHVKTGNYPSSEGACRCLRQL
uniref:Uncharacterized protein n=1 Tax=Parascaris equorum TaxID=6256 RepID=A0A914S4J0_PAREQ